MRRLLTVLILAFIFHSPAFAQNVTEDQEWIAQVNGAVGDISIAFAAPPTISCTATASIAADTSIDMAFATPAVTDNQGNTYTAIQSAVAGQQKALIAVADDIFTGSTFVITFHPDVSGNPVYAQIAMKSFCGLANPSIDQTATAADPGPQAADASITSGSTVQANETAIAVMGVLATGVSDMAITTPSGWTAIQSEQDATVHQAGQSVWRNFTTIGAKSAAWSHVDVTGSAAYDGWVAAIVTLKDSDPGSAPVATRRRSPIVQ